MYHFFWNKVLISIKFFFLRKEDEEKLKQIDN